MRPLGYRALWGLGWLAVRLVASGSVAHAQSLEGLQVAWDGPAACPAPARLHAEVIELLGADFALSGRAHARVRLRGSAGDGYRLELGVRTEDATGRRTLELASCAEAQKAAPVLIALSLRPDAPLVTDPDEPAVPVVPAARADSNAIEAGSDADASATPRPALPRFGFGVVGGLDLSSLQEPSAIFALRGSFRHGLLQLRSELGLVVPRRSPVAGAAAAEISSGLASLGVGACLGPWLGPIQMSGCGGVELGLYWAASHGVAVPEGDRTLWSAGLLGAQLAYPVGRISLQLDALAVLPFTRPVLSLADRGTQHTTPAVGFRALVGLIIGLGSVDSRTAGH